MPMLIPSRGPGHSARPDRVPRPRRRRTGPKSTAYWSEVDGGTRRVRIAGRTPVPQDSATTFLGGVVLYLAPDAVIPVDDPDLHVVADCERDGTLRRVPPDGEGAAVGLDRLRRRGGGTASQRCRG